MKQDVPGAVSFAEGQIARLLSGRVEMWELAMTGGLWRVTGQQLAAAAAAGEHAKTVVQLSPAPHAPSSQPPPEVCILTTPHCPADDADADDEATGSQSAAAAASAGGGGGGGADDVKGPHASLAVRLSQRDPDKKWLLGERLSYVLLTGEVLASSAMLAVENTPCINIGR